MMATASVQDLYRQAVLDHSRQPRNFRRLAAPDATATGHNPLCGDKVTVYLKFAGEHLEEISFEASGCAICTASASLMTEHLQQLKRPEILAGIDDFMARFGSGPRRSEDADDPLAALATVRDYPSRIRCATLPWKTVGAALAGSTAPVTTE